MKSTEFTLTFEGDNIEEGFYVSVDFSCDTVISDPVHFIEFEENLRSSVEQGLDEVLSSLAGRLRDST